MKNLLVAAIGAALALAGGWTVAQAQDAVPDLYNGGVGYTSRGGNLMPPPPDTPGAHGPINDHPDYPHYGNASGHTPTARVGDWTHALLQPWARERSRELNEPIATQGAVGFDAAQRCWPPGVPGVLTFTAEPMVILQSAGQVTFTYQRGQVVRRIYLNEEHPENLTPTWMGHSVGHYEGDTLVVDTVALTDRTFIDNFRTPHSDQLHVVERYRLLDGSPDLITDESRPGDDSFVTPDRKVLQVLFAMEDPGAYTETWTAMQLYEPSDRIDESICAENNNDNFDQDLAPLPSDTTPDF